MIALGVLMVLAGGAGAVWGVNASTTRRRPFDLIAALVAPVGLVTALVGGVLVFVPGFFR
ncbi:MAG TPA: hypothetical protein VFF06_17140 [Polyangia bacterium]|nr:hypothetical protein [Polyangia bacterium]